MQNLYAGIDVSNKSLEVCIIDSSGKKINPKIKTFSNNLPSARKLEDYLADTSKAHKASALFIATEATGFLDWHLLELLSESEKLSPFSPSIYRFNPKQIKDFKKIYQETHKTDEIDALLIADRLRFSLPEHKFNSNMDYLPLQRITRFRAHIAKQMTVEKNYFISHLFLKFSAYSQVKPFSDNFGATSQAVVEEFFSIDELAKISVEDLVDFVIEKGKNRFKEPHLIVEKLKQVARESYRIHKKLAKSVNFILAQTLLNIRTLKKSLTEANSAIEKEFSTRNVTLSTIPGIGLVYSAGIFAEIGDILRFSNQAQLARYAGLAWKKSQSGDFSADETPMMKSANSILRYYLIEAANSVKKYCPEYRNFYFKKYKEVNKHQHKRALVLTARKLVRLIYALLKRGEIYQEKKIKMS